MFPIEQDAMLVEDREDLLALLHMRFGRQPSGVVDAIYDIRQLDALQRLILAAANSPHWEMFLEELNAGDSAARIAGQAFSPMEDDGRELEG
ncbi:MAG TPA: hypothetical protein VFK44_02190 [Bacillales bacterium]|nr:hypothetical protein [Bacillales bacterium]